MASSSSIHNNGMPLATLLEWYKIRDTFFGQNEVSQNLSLALQLAASCEHPDARWLTKACAGKDMTTREGAKKVFSSLGPNDARTLCFVWLMGDRRDLTSLQRSAELGYPFALALLAERTQGEESLKFAQLAASQGERDGIHQLGLCFSDGIGCEIDSDKAKECFLRAIEFGDVFAMEKLGVLLSVSDPQRWRWWGRAAALGNSWMLFTQFAEQVYLFNSGSGSTAVMFAIGQALQGHVNEELGTIFKTKSNFHFRIRPAKQAIAFYKAQIKATKDAMHAWTQVGIRWKVVKDVRKLIAKLIWDSREEALYET
jgi:TPR repeat protein